MTETYEPTDEAADEFGAESDPIDDHATEDDSLELFEPIDDDADEFGASDVDPDQVVMPDDWDPSLYTAEELAAEPIPDDMGD